MNAMRTLSVAGIQVESRNLDVRGNLSRAELLVEAAAERGAALVLCPEFLAPGYTYDVSIWDVAEPRGGPTEQWLARMARQHRLYIGATYLEASGDDFFTPSPSPRPTAPSPAGCARSRCPASRGGSSAVAQGRR